MTAVLDISDLRVAFPTTEGRVSAALGVDLTRHYPHQFSGGCSSGVARAPGPDRVAVMYLGKIVESGRRDDIYDHPAHGRPGPGPPGGLPLRRRAAGRALSGHAGPGR